METTIIKLEPTTGSANVVVRTDATFEEAFGDYSDARGRGRARRKSRKLSKIADKREVKQARRGGRQADRLARRSTRKGARQEMRSSQQEARQERKNVRSSGRQSRKDSKNVSEQDRENYNQDQENTRLSKDPVDSDSESTDETTKDSGSNNAPSSAPMSNSQDSGYQDSGYQDSGYQDSGSQESGYQDSGSNYENEGSQDEGYGDSQSDDSSNQTDSEYSQEENEFADDSIFNFEGMDGKVVVTPLVKDNVYKLKNNARAHKDLSDRRALMERNGDNTKGIDMQINNTRQRMSELKSCLDDYCNADGSQQQRRRRNDEVSIAMGRKVRRRRNIEHGGSEVPVQDGLDASFSKQRIEVPASSNFDGYSDLGRPVIIDGVVQGDEKDFASDLYNDGDEPTVIDLYSNADGGIFKDKKVMGSVLIGIGVGALILYLAKKKNWI